MNFDYQKIQDLITFYMPYVIFMVIAYLFFDYNKLPPRDNTKVNSIDSLKLMPFSGTITSIRPRSRGSYYIGMIDKIRKDSLTYSLYGGNLFSDEYDIKVGDSISKYANSDTIIFYHYEGKELDKKSIVYTLQ